MREKPSVPKLHHFEIGFRHGAIVPGHFPSRRRAEAYALLMSAEATIKPVYRHDREKGHRQLMLNRKKPRKGRGSPINWRLQELEAKLAKH